MFIVYVNTISTKTNFLCMYTYMHILMYILPRNNQVIIDMLVWIFDRFNNYPNGFNLHSNERCHMVFFVWGNPPLS